MKIYLSGPMSGLLDFNRPAFTEAAAKLRAEGHEVIVPHETPSKGTEWEDYMRSDIIAMLNCESIAMLPGWSESRGAKIEYRLAVDLGFEVRFMK